MRDLLDINSMSLHKNWSPVSGASLQISFLQIPLNMFHFLSFLQFCSSGSNCSQLIIDERGDGLVPSEYQAISWRINNEHNAWSLEQPQVPMS